MYESQHHINTSKNMARYKQVVRTPPSIKRYTLESRPSPPPLRSQPLSFLWMKVMTKLHCLMYFNLWTYQKGRVSLRAQGTKRQVIFHFAYACPKINTDMVLNKVTGSLAILSMICPASKILCQLGCHLLWLCGSTCCCAQHVKEDDSVWQGLSIICLAAW